MKLGFSTGCLFRQLNTIEAMKLIAKHDIKAVELCMVRLYQYEEDEEWVKMKEELKSFEYISVHAPNDVKYIKGSTGEKVLLGLINLNNVRPLDMVVFHPQKEMDFGLFNDLPFPVGFENMDKSKDYGKTIDDLLAIFSQNSDFKFIFDLNHVHTNDPSMEAAKGFYDKLGDRLVEIHISGYDKLHEPLYQTKQTEIMDEVRDGSTQLIIESIIDLDEINKEFNYINNYLSNKYG